MTSQVKSAAARRPLYGEGMEIQEPSRVGPLLREWRRRRKLSQLELALRADSSTRHLSCVETGRARPSRELLLRLAEHLDIPLRDRNGLLLAAGYAPAYRESPLDSEPMAMVRSAIGAMLAGHEPYPAAAIDRAWNIVDRNDAMSLLMGTVPPRLAESGGNVMRLILHPEGLARSASTSRRSARTPSAGCGTRPTPPATTTSARCTRRCPPIRSRRASTPTPARWTRPASSSRCASARPSATWRSSARSPPSGRLPT